jgi:hypothetical protein
LKPVASKASVIQQQQPGPQALPRTGSLNKMTDGLSNTKFKTVIEPALIKVRFYILRYFKWNHYLNVRNI